MCPCVYIQHLVVPLYAGPDRVSSQEKLRRYQEVLTVVHPQDELYTQAC